MTNQPRHGTYYRESYAMKRTKRRARKKKAMIALVALLIVLIAVAIGFFAYNKIVNDKLSFSGSNATQSLTSKSSDSAIYTLIKIDAGKDESVSASYNTKELRELYFLMRTDAANSGISFMFFPTDLKVTLSDKKVHPLWQATNFGGDAELISVLNDFCDIKINHFIEASGEDLSKLVDNIGGLDINLSTELDDPHAGTQTLHSGDVTLDKQSTETLLRTRSVLGSYDTISKNLTAFASALMKKMTSSGGFDLANVIDQFAEGVATDMKASDFTDFASKFANKEVTISDTSIPGTSTKSSDTSETVFSARESETSQILEKFRSGGDPRDTNKDVTDFDKSQVHVEVRNGAGITGAASACKTFLESKGYSVDSAGNADDGTTYEETLIVYMDDQYENAANSIVNELGCGRVVNGGDYYTSTSNVIVIIGLDWSKTS